MDSSAKARAHLEVFSATQCPGSHLRTSLLASNTLGDSSVTPRLSAHSVRQEILSNLAAFLDPVGSSTHTEKIPGAIQPAQHVSIQLHSTRRHKHHMAAQRRIQSTSPSQRLALAPVPPQRQHKVSRLRLHVAVELTNGRIEVPRLPLLLLCLPHMPVLEAKQVRPWNTSYLQ